jgi:hypothetical protein
MGSGSNAAGEVLEWEGDSRPTLPARLGLRPGAVGVFQGGAGTMLKGRVVSDKTIWV